MKIKPTKKVSVTSKTSQMKSTFNSEKQKKNPMKSDLKKQT